MAILKWLVVPVMRYAQKLKYPTLFKWAIGLFVVSVLFPDPIPLLDEVIFGLGALLISRWKETPLVNSHKEERDVLEGQAKRVG